MAGLHTPLSTLHVRPHDRPRMTRGRCGSLLLHRNGLAPSTPCRSPGAPHSTALNAGVDISKDHRDACLHPAAETRRFTNDAKGRRALIAWLIPHRVVRVVYEAA